MKAPAGAHHEQRLKPVRLVLSGAEDYAPPRKSSMAVKLRAPRRSFSLPTPNEPDFEQALSELEKLVERLERGDLPLDEALKTFERGVTLTRQCQTALKDAQK